MKKIHLPLFVLSAVMLLASCTASSGSGSATTSSSGATTSATSSATTSSSSKTSVTATSSEDSIPEGTASSYESVVIDSSTSEGVQVYQTDDFLMSTEDGSFSVVDSTITVLKGGTYVLQGTWNGVICGDLSDEDAVELDLNGVTLKNDSNSCIYFLGGDKLRIKSLEGTTNAIIDGRALQTVEDEGQGGGAIYSKIDTDLVGKGTLNVTGTFNNGVHVTKDLEVKNVTLTVTAPNNVLKGNDSVTVVSGNLTLISSGGDGIKTVDSDISSSGNQRGTIDIQGGTIDISSAYDGIDASYDLNVSGGDITIRTNAYRTSTSANAIIYAGPGGQGGPGGPGGGGGIPGGQGSSSEKAESSAKGLKAANKISISGGTIDIASYDDSIHANNDDALENGATPLGDIDISGGTINLVASDDAVHADGTLSISGGSLTVEESHEGIEANIINISGGETTCYANDDGVNASKAINVTDGYLFAEVSPNGDTDGIDSNGTITISGGTVIAAGPNNMNAAAIDADGSVRVTGGTLIAFGYAALSSSLTKGSKSGTYGGKAYTVTFANGSVTTKKLQYSGHSGCYTWSSLGSLSSIA